MKSRKPRTDAEALKADPCAAGCPRGCAHDLAPAKDYTTTKHTPLPWISSHRAVVRDGIVKPIAVCQTPEDAALIVRAVNSHEAMVQALIKCRELLDNSDVRDYVGRKLGEQSALHAALNESRAALKLAEGE